MASHDEQMAVQEKIAEMFDVTSKTGKAGTDIVSTLMQDVAERMNTYRQQEVNDFVSRKQEKLNKDAAQQYEEHKQGYDKEKATFDEKKGNRFKLVATTALTLAVGAAVTMMAVPAVTATAATVLAAGTLPTFGVLGAVGAGVAMVSESIGNVYAPRPGPEPKPFNQLSKEQVLETLTEEEQNRIMASVHLAMAQDDVLKPDRVEGRIYEVLDNSSLSLTDKVEVLANLEEFFSMNGMDELPAYQRIQEVVGKNHTALLEELPSSPEMVQQTQEVEAGKASSQPQEETPQQQQRQETPQPQAKEVNAPEPEPVAQQPAEPQQAEPSPTEDTVVKPTDKTAKNREENITVVEQDGVTTFAINTDDLKKASQQQRSNDVERGGSA